MINDDIIDNEFEDEDNDDEGLTLEEIREIWGVDLSDPDLDVDDIPGDR